MMDPRELEDEDEEIILDDDENDIPRGRMKAVMPIEMLWAGAANAE